MKISIPFSLLIAASLFGANTAKSSARQAQNVPELPTAIITPSVSTQINQGANVELSVDFIYWRSITAGMEYAFSGVSDGGGFVAVFQNVSKGRLQTPEFHFEPGFKVALDWLIDHDGWDLNFQYTWLNDQESHNSINGKSGLGIGASIPTVFSDGAWFYSDLFSAGAKWSQSFNVLDVKLGRNFYTSRYLTLRPHVGMKFGWIDAKLDVNYAIEEDDEDNPFIEVRSKQNMWGLGLRTGLDSGWYFTKNWGLYTDLSFTGLWSFFRTRETNLETTTLSILTLNNGEHIQKIVPVIEWSFGARYMNWFKGDRYQFLFQAGWEEQIWLEFNNFPRVNVPWVGSLSIQGLTAKAAFVF